MHMRPVFARIGKIQLYRSLVNQEFCCCHAASTISNKYLDKIRWAKLFINLSSRAISTQVSSQHCSTHFSSLSSASNTNSVSKLPEVIEVQCQEWMEILQAENASDNVQYSWLKYPLICKNALRAVNSFKIILDTSILKPETRDRVLKQFRLGLPIELRPLGSEDSDKPNLCGTVTKHFSDAIFITLNIKEQLIDVHDFPPLNGNVFDIRVHSIQKNFYDQLDFFAKRNDPIDGWEKMRGYHTLLSSYPSIDYVRQKDENVSLTKLPVASLDLSHRNIDNSNEAQDLDESQLRALNAVVDFQEPIVAIHGPSGSGKSRLLVQYLHMLYKLGKRTLVIHNSHLRMYILMNKFCEHANENGWLEDCNFFCHNTYNNELGSQVIKNPALQKLIASCCYERGSLQHDSDLVGFSHGGNDDKITLGPDDTRSPEHPHPIAHGNINEYNINETYELLDEKMLRKFKESRQHCIIFSTLNRGMLAMFRRAGISFDLVIFDEAAQITEFECWWAALPLTSNIRLFGDIFQPARALHSTIGQQQVQQSASKSSLLGRLDTQFGSDRINYYLKHQYRSNPVIHEWPNRAFYRERAIETHNSVQNIRLDDFLLNECTGDDAPTVTGLKSYEFIKDPFVLVDLGKIDRHKEKWMFEPDVKSDSLVNWGEAILAAIHMKQLIAHTSLQPHQIAYISPKYPQHMHTNNILRWLLSSSPTIDSKQFNVSNQLRSQQMEAMIYSFVIAHPTEILGNNYHLKHFAWHMTRTRRQFMLFANSDSLRCGCDNARKLLETFQTSGRIVAPNEIFRISADRFWWILKEAKRHASMERRQRLQELEQQQKAGTIIY